MIIDLSDVAPDSVVQSDVCIVGAGPAGIVLALELAARGMDVALLEAGGAVFEDASQALYEGTVTGDGQTDISFSRLRQFGGTSQHWAGLCAPLEPIDFEKRPGVPHSGWPIGRADLDPFYPKAQDYLQLGPFNYETTGWSEDIEGRTLPLDKDVVRDVVYQQSPPTRFAETYMDDVRANERIRAYLHANLTDIRLKDGSETVDHLVAKTLGGNKVRFRGRAYVLACGGVETARLLLNARDQRPAGLGNENDLVGRYFMDHMNIASGAILLADEATDVSVYGNYQHVDGAMFEIGLQLSPDVLREERLLNNTGFLKPEFQSAAYNEDYRGHGWVSFSTLVKSFAAGNVPDRPVEHYCNVIDNADDIAVGVYRQVMRRIVDPGEVLVVKVRQDAEQSPNPDSRVTLTEEVDPLGLNRASLDWRIATEDMESIRRTHEIIGAAIGAAGIGRFRVELTDPEDKSEVYTAFHHMGTTRMHADPREGVVDADCRMHSVENLYIAGSSVFTTGGTANPTLTIVAMAIRLAEHLASVETAVLRGSIR